MGEPAAIAVFRSRPGGLDFYLLDYFMDGGHERGDFSHLLSVRAPPGIMDAFLTILRNDVGITPDVLGKSYPEQEEFLDYLRTEGIARLLSREAREVYAARQAAGRRTYPPVVIDIPDKCLLLPHKDIRTPLLAYDLPVD